MSRSPRRSGRVTPKGTTPGSTRSTRPDTPGPRSLPPAAPRSGGRIHEPRRGYVPPSTNRTGYRGNR